MTKIAIVTDSTAYLTDQQAKDNNITVVPIPVILDGTVYDEGKDITPDEYYAKLKAAKTFPSTSQPPLGEMITLYENLRNEGYTDIISIHLANTISGFQQTLRNTVDEIKGVNITVYDSQITVMLMGWLVLEAAKMAREGSSVKAIVARLDDLRSTIDEYFIVNDIQNLVRGGRLSNAAGFVAGMLRIKPLLTFDPDTDKIVAIEKIRSLKKAYARVEKLFDNALQNIDYPVRALIIHANDPEEAERWKAELQTKYPDIEFEISFFGPVIGTHLGEKAIALAWMKDFTKA